VPDCHAYAREFVSLIYKIHKVERKESSSSFLQLSTRLDEQINSEGEEQNQSPNLWPTLRTEQTNPQMFVPVHSQNPSAVSGHPELCIFMTEDLPIGHVIRLNKDSRLVPEWCFQARRHDLKPGWGQGWNKTDTKANDENLSDKISGLLSLCQVSRSLIGPVDSQSTKGKGPERPWKPRDDHTHIRMVSRVPMGWTDMVELGEERRSHGSRVTSVTYKGSRPTNLRRVDSPYSMRPPMLSSVRPQDNIHGSLRKRAHSPGDYGVSEGDQGSAYPRLHNTGQSIEHPNSTDRTRPPILGSIGRPLDTDRNRSINEEIGEASSSSSSKAAQKRRRVDRDEQFNKDDLSQDDFDRLLESGFFG
jgi:hypothetical protein